MSENNKILVGKIVGAQGLHGEVRVQTYTQNPTDFQNLKIENQNLKFIRALPSSSVIIAKIDGINDRNAAESLRNTELFINRDDLPQLANDEYYATDLIGMRVGANTVVAVQNYGAGDILELSNGEMVSFAGAKVDLVNNKITF
ncbi:MAG: ribosome maturation factor RimM [Alphaproteobacteria bacterium]|nr:ribosome maturation factor RimM [Alphaproteobacteria bacterium]